MIRLATETMTANIGKKVHRYGKYWYRFKNNKLSIVGLGILIVLLLVAVFAPYISPYPSNAGLFVDFSHALRAPSLAHPFGTDEDGRDVLTRVMFAFRYSFTLVGVVLGITVVPGVMLGLVSGYYVKRWFSIAIMRVADIFVAVPPLLLALSVASVMRPTELNVLMAISLVWWPWYTRLVYSQTSSLRNEDYVRSAQLMGASSVRIMISEILPNELGSILTKVSLDAGWVILIGAALSYVGLGAPPPTPDLGTMIAEGSSYLPTYWWIAVFPAIAVVMVILAFNLLGDGIRDMFSSSIR
ncbi:MAG: ABC transporter permease [Candidatus Thermoplasmatota archaeon]|nr:ABC transporter permease [Candidatus Thermoplasmatota archaeon]